MPDSPFVGPSYSLTSRPTSVQRTVNLMPVPIEPGNERAGWVFKDVPGLVKVQTTAPPPPEPPEGLLYCDFNDGTATDQTPDPVTATVGPGAIIESGNFKSKSPPNLEIQSTEVSWTNTLKYAQATDQAWTLQGKFNWSTIASGTSRKIIRLDSNTSNFVLLTFHGAGGAIDLNTQGGTQLSMLGPYGSGVDTHFAIVQAAMAVETRVYIAGALAGSFAGGLTVSGSTTVSLGNYVDQGAENYGVTWVHWILGELYTGSTYTIPSNT